MKYLVLGAGMMGSATVFDLASSKGTTRVTLADIDGSARTHLLVHSSRHSFVGAHST